MDKTKQTLAIALAAVLVVVAGGWFFLISPQRSSVAGLQDQTATQNATNASLQLKIQQLKAEAVEQPADQAQLRAIAKRLPSDLAEATLVASLSKAALAANVDLQTITPGSPILVSAPVAAATVAPATSSAAGAAAPGAVAKAPAANPNQLYSIPLNLTVQGNYFDLEMFVHNLEAMQRAMLINQLNLAAGAGTAAVVATVSPGSGTTSTTAKKSVTAKSGTGSATSASGKSTTSKSTSGKAGAKSTKPVPGTAAAAQAAAEAQTPFVVEPNTLTLTLTGSVFSMYSSTPIPAAPAAPTSAPTK